MSGTDNATSTVSRLTLRDVAVHGVDDDSKSWRGCHLFFLYYMRLFDVDGFGDSDGGQFSVSGGGWLGLMLRAVGRLRLLRLYRLRVWLYVVLVVVL